MLSHKKLLPILLILGQLPLVILFMRNLWLRPYYHFFPAVVVGAAFLLWQQWPREGSRAVVRHDFWTWLLMLVGLGCDAAAIRLPSSWLAGVGSLSIFGGVLSYYAGSARWRNLVPAWLVLWLIIPLPLGWDHKILAIQNVLTAYASSLILDVLRVGHFLNGAVLEFGASSVSVSAVCNVLPPLFALPALAAIFAVWARRPLVPMGLLLTASLFWSVVAGLARVVAVVLGQIWFQLDMSQGWPLICLALGLLVIAFGLLLSTEGLLFFLLSPVPFRAELDCQNPFARAWNLLGTRLHLASPETWFEDDLPQEGASAGAATASVPGRGGIRTVMRRFCVAILQLPFHAWQATFGAFLEWGAARRSARAAQRRTFDEEGDVPESDARTWRRIASALLLPLRLPSLMLLAACSFLFDWCTSRVASGLLRGLPAFAVATACVAAIGVGWGLQVPNGTLVAFYSQVAEDAFRQQRFSEAECLMRKLAVLDRANPQLLYGLALVAEKSGDLVRARRLMEAIAPRHQAGYAAAHDWLANDMFRRLEKLAPEDLKLLRYHLARAIEADPENGSAHAMIGKLCFAEGRLNEAAAHTSLAAKQNPDLLLPLARIHVLRRDKSSAKQAGEQARDHFRKLVESQPKNVESRLNWAMCENLLGEHAMTVEVLRQGADLTGDDKFKEALARAYVSWFESLKGKPNADVAELRRLLEAALQNRPHDIEAIGSLASLAANTGLGVDEVTALLNRELTEGRAPAAIHFMLGTIAAKKQDWTASTQHFEQSDKLSPNQPATLNNLAWALAHLDPPQYDRANQVANRAFELDPRNPDVRDTRGYVLFKLGRFKEALAELETALQSRPDSKDLHSLLAEIYQQLGQRDLAAMHRDLAKRIAEKR